MSTAPAEVQVKICGLTRTADARLAADAGADYLGAILSDGFARSVPPETAREFPVGGAPPLVAVLVDVPVRDALALAERAGASVLQLHGDEPPEALRQLRDGGSPTLWKVVRPRAVDELLRAVERYGETADALLLEGWHADLKGGAGVRFDWDLVARVREEWPAGLRLVAAGGLTPENVARAVAALAPDVVDVSSGVEAARGIKDPERVEAFIRAARGGPVPEEAR